MTHKNEVCTGSLDFDGDVAGASGAWDASEMLSCTRTWGGGVLAVGLPFESSFFFVFSCFVLHESYILFTWKRDY